MLKILSYNKISPNIKYTFLFIDLGNDVKSDVNIVPELEPVGMSSTVVKLWNKVFLFLSSSTSIPVPGYLNAVAEFIENYY